MGPKGFWGSREKGYLGSTGDYFRELGSKLMVLGI